jgi:DNA-binding transcriptional regulator YdaS (Cro superfamily)
MLYHVRMDLKTYLSDRSGRGSELARELGVKAPAVYQVAHGKPCPPAWVRRIEVWSGGQVTRIDLRPHDWQLYWPDGVELEGGAS